MVKCPKCKAEINELIYARAEIYEDIMWIDENGKLEFDPTDEYAGEWCVFKCPKCNAVLFEDFEDAEEFLKGNL